MIGGHMKSSFVALIAAAAIVGGISSAQAADLGGDCCADLEERVAELEATTARKGNRKVSLTVSGWVNEAVLFWDDGVESNAYIGTNLVAQTRFRFVGNAKINADWSAGYLLEIGVGAARLDGQDATGDDVTAAALGIRHSAWWLQSKQLGKLWVGQTSSATDAITEINLANTLHFATQNSAAAAGSFAFTGAGPARTIRSFAGGANGVSTANTGGQIGEGERHNVVKYESPTFAGFAVSAAFGEDDLWDVAIRYAGEFSGFKIAAGVGYLQWTDGNTATLNEYNCRESAVPGDVDCSQIGMSGAIMHVPTGLYVHAAYGIRTDDNVGAGGDDSSTQLYVQAGIEQNFFGIGKSTLFGEYQQWDVGGNGLNADNVSTEMTMYGVGFNQSIDAAAMDLYIRYNHYDADRTVGAVTLSHGDIQTIMAGGKINF